MSDGAFSMKSYELVEMANTYPEMTGPSWPPRELAAAHKFLFGHHTEVPESFVYFGEDLVKRGLFRLPFPRTIVEFLAGKNGDSPDLDRLVLVCEQLAMYEPWEAPQDDVPPILIMVLPFVRTRSGGWSMPPQGDNGPLPVAIGAGRSLDRAGDFKIHPEYTKDPFWDYMASAALALCPAACAMMMSKSATVKHVAPPEALVRAREKSAKPRLFEFHVVTVPTESRVRGRSVGIARRPPMLHWRRGHYRRLSLEKIVPVAPCLVGAEERGVIAKVYDGKSAHIVGQG
jgi:hypothetical protein